MVISSCCNGHNHDGSSEETKTATSSGNTMKEYKGFNLVALGEELRRLESRLAPLASPLVLSHNDLQHGNIMLKVYSWTDCCGGSNLLPLFGSFIWNGSCFSYFVFLFFLGWGGGGERRKKMGMGVLTTAPR